MSEVDSLAYKANCPMVQPVTGRGPKSGLGDESDLWPTASKDPGTSVLQPYDMNSANSLNEVGRGRQALEESAVWP